MKKVFLYLYPIEEYMKDNLCEDGTSYDLFSFCCGLKPFPILNESIQKRYRDKGYQVVYALFPNRKLFGIDLKKEDKIIYTDCLFDSPFKYPNEQFIIEQLGEVDELIIGGYHSLDCVKKIGEKAMSMDIDTLVDLDMTELFFDLYYNNSYFNVEEYDLEKFWYYATISNKDFGERIMVHTSFSSPIYGLNKPESKKLSKNIKSNKI